MDNEIFLKLYEEQFHIPIIDGSEKIWFFRTQGGTYYFDFYTNSYIAIGWNKIKKNFILNENADREDLKTYISNEYPDEKRPGLVLNQIITFYTTMKEGDWVVIPTEGTKQIAIGKLEGFEGEFHHQLVYDENNKISNYTECEFSHQRHVKWFKQVDIEHDLYLTRALRGQQTISDITDFSEFIFRNLFPCFIRDGVAHFTLQKRSSGGFGFRENLAIQRSISDILDNTSRLYSEQDISDQLTLKTAVGSPGFMEIIIPLLHSLPNFPTATIFFIILCQGRAKGKDGKDYSGIAAIITAVNNFFDSIWNKHQVIANVAKTEAETRKINAEAKRAEAEAEKVLAESRKINAETQKAEAESKLTEAQVENVRLNNELLQRNLSAASTRKILDYYQQVPEEEKIKRFQSINQGSADLQKAAGDSGIVFSDSDQL